MPRPRALLALIAALAAIVGVPSLVVPAMSEEASGVVDGSARGPDNYFPLDGNGGYDVRHYRIDNAFVPRDGRLRGRTTLHATALDDALRSFSLDLVLTPDWVKVDGRAARFAKPRTHELRVTPATPVEAGSDFTVSVGYHGRPAQVRATGVSPFFSRSGEAMAIGEPQIGAWWFAANETPADKASYDVTLRVPRGQQAVSSGHLVERTTGRAWTTWRWRQHRPIVSYLAFFAAGRFEVRRTTVDGLPTVYAVSKQLPRGAREQSFRLLQRTPGIVRWLEQWLGPYPYDTSGGVVTGLDTGFALENAGRPTYPFIGGPGDRWNITLVVHEMAHQWFGNDVSVARWRDIWVNEGLASYAEWRYEHETWDNPVSERLRTTYRAYDPDGGFWKVRLSDPGSGKIFHNAIYERGAMALAALHCRVGEADLDTTLRRWVSERAGGHGTVDDFRALAEDVSEQDLAAFFTAWLDARERPAATTANGLSGCA